MADVKKVEGMNIVVIKGLVKTIRKLAKHKRIVCIDPGDYNRSKRPRGYKYKPGFGVGEKYAFTGYTGNMAQEFLFTIQPGKLEEVVSHIEGLKVK